MADNITAPAAGTNFATDEIVGVHYPRTKIGTGADGAYADVSSDNPLPVADPVVTAAIQALAGLLATDGTLAALVAKLPASLGPKAVSTSLSITPATSSDMATNAGIAAALAAATLFPAIQPVSASALPLPAGAATQATLAALLAVGTETYTLAGNITLVAAATGPTVTVPRGGYFFFDAAFSGTSPSLKLQRLGSDGTTWMDVVTRTATGTGDPVGIPNGAQLRVYNAGSGSLTNVSAVLG